ncbi:leucine-rich repeat-containing serine/threonine-protein kinase [Aquincola tertiaricarbonis]|uniref:Leucine-rich repeat-containing serine/threonine-protein kinase n=1 Tax=Aquincola tertiaricarbonis TaxID=391953 RepID=A0ABY4S3M1_AQUTE|nr:leucine-rich repeat-containing protein kinase family protein [Aquincola tertiaricarbonis]URI08041.1 leucine-rich repeat-containing serine/threonine-protein kinase [Aquincola tertiaricarbonis]
MNAATPNPPDTLARLRAGQLQGATRLDLRGCGLTELPPEVLALADTLEVLDLSNNALTTLPEGLATLTRLHTLFASSNRFERLPPMLGRLPRLDTLGFKANRIAQVPAQALAPTLRWLILTDNQVAELPPTLADCAPMQKLMLAGNQLQRLPEGLGRLQRLELLRLSANRFERVQDALPEELLALPRLAWLAHAGNPFSAAQEQAAPSQAAARPIAWDELRLQALLGEGASGHIHAARWQPADAPAQDVAVKLFKGAMTSDGLPQCEMAATLVAGRHPALVGLLGVLRGHPQGVQGLVMHRLPLQWAALAGPPSMASCSRDVYAPGLRLPAAHARAIAQAAEAALAHLHACGLSHGDLYAHNLLVDGQGGALLSDFGAASFLPLQDTARTEALKAIDRRALQVLHDELQAHSAPA